ncbi:amidase [Nesterenkonia muleiensis]|uniref:amidase n=1 Tax=Nesterenkonia muleiensis TaxID=2282648 RepID=UPI000E71A7DD|nr:amidase [Nesterenkonia muleiensis]
MLKPSLTAHELRDKLRSRDVSAIEAAEYYLKRIHEIDGDINSIIWLDDEDVMNRAHEADRRITSGKARQFEGVPIPIKCLSPVQGQPFSNASYGVRERLSDFSVPAVERLEQAGFVLMGHSNAPELGLLSVSENVRFGKTRNPWNIDYTSGGSSGGASSAVAGGLAPLAHASDGAGSTRIPASLTGLIGLKPTRSRITPIIRSMEDAVTDGVITRTVEDTAALLDILSVPDPLACYAPPIPNETYLDTLYRPVRRLRIGLMTEAPIDVYVDPQNVDAAKRLATELEGTGHTVFPVEPEVFSPELVDGFGDLLLGAASWATPLDEPEKADSYVKTWRSRAESAHAGQYVDLAFRMQFESRRIVAQWGRDFDLLVTPTMASLASRVGEVYDDVRDKAHLGVWKNTLLGRDCAFTSLCNMSGLPAISLPVHFDSNGLPVGAQLVGGLFREDLILKVAAEMESVFEWHKFLAEPARV